MREINPYFDGWVKIIQGDALKVLTEMPEESVQCVVTSPPYWGLRKYAGEQEMVWEDNHCEHRWDSVPPRRQICSICGATKSAFGLESTPEEYVSHTIEFLRAIRRVLRKDGVVFWNIGDSYYGGGGASGHTAETLNLGRVTSSYNAPEGISLNVKHPTLKPKDLCLIPFRVAIAAQQDGWFVRSVIIWSKPNPMPESVHGSHFIRHYVTIKEYEKLSGVRSTQSGNQGGSADLSRMSPSQVSHCQEALPPQSERTSNRESLRTETRCEGKAPSSQPFPPGQKEQSQIRGNREGQDNEAEGNRAIPPEARIQTEISRETSTNQRQTRADSTKEISQSALQQDTQRQISETTGLCEAEASNSRGTTSNGRGLARDIKGSQEPLPLLPQEESANDRPHNTNQQGGQTSEGKHSPSLSELQFLEEGQDSDALIECPGCPKCEAHNGYILRQGAGRPTESHEYILMLTKSAHYYWDMEAVREPNETINELHYPSRQKRIGDNNFPISDGRNRFGCTSGWNPSGRNLRSVWTFATEPYPGAHFATFPRELPKRCILAASKEGDIILDPFSGSGTVGEVAKSLGRKAILIDISAEYCKLAQKRVEAVSLPLKGIEC